MSAASGQNPGSCLRIFAKSSKSHSFDGPSSAGVTAGVARGDYQRTTGLGARVAARSRPSGHVPFLPEHQHVRIRVE